MNIKFQFSPWATLHIMHIINYNTDYNLKIYYMELLKTW